jgi:hypothetical protein
MDSLHQNPNSAKADFSLEDACTAHAPAFLEKLQELGRMEVDGLSPCDLTNDIHPMNRLDRFTNVIEDEYDFIRPALQLASKFLTEDAMMDFWNHICHGTYKMQDYEDGDQIFHIASGLRGKDPQAALQTTRQKLLEMAKDIKIQFIDKDTHFGFGHEGAKSSVQLILAQHN